MSESRWSIALAGLALVAAGIAAYANSLGAPLVLDDIATISDNPSIRSLATALVPPANVGTGGRPVANVSFALNYLWAGTDVRDYHLSNLAIHLAAGLVLFGLLRRTLAQPALAARVPSSARLAVAFGTAAVWLLHPLQTASVTYLSQRTESLMGLFYLLTLYAFVRGATERRSRWFIVAVIACFLGIATKEVMMTAPVIVLLYDRTFISGSFTEAWRRHRTVYLGLAASWLLLAYLLVDVQQRGIGYKAATPWTYALTESRVLLHYLKLSIWPTPLVFDYGPGIVSSLAEVWPYAVGVVLLLGLTIVALRRWPVAGFVGAWFFVILAPTSSFVPVGAQPMAENRLYLPLAALCAAALIMAGSRFGRRGALAIATTLSLAAASATIARNRDYQSALTLWNDTVAKAPHNSRAHAGVGAALLEQGKPADAISPLRRALELDPQLAEAHNNLANALSDTGRSADALAHFARALELAPGKPSTHYNYGSALAELGRTADAIAQQQAALKLRPQFPEAQCALAHALVAAGRLAEAIPHYETALKLQPGFASAHFGLGNTLLNTGRAAEAISHYEATLRAQPGTAMVHLNLGNAFATTGRIPEAITQYETALRLQPDLAQARNNLEAVRKMLR